MVLEDREIRVYLCWTSWDAPPQHVSPRVVKYTGTSTSPEWEDEEPGRVFDFPRYSVESAQTYKDKFETLCHVEADLSTAPYTSKLDAAGKTGYKRECDIVLLVGLTELKARVDWIDSATVRVYIASHVSIHLTHFPCA